MAKILSEKAKKISGMFLSYVLHTNQRRCFYWLESMGFSNCIDLPSQLQKKEMAEYLIENGANGNSTCSKLKTLLHFTLMLNHEEFVILLLWMLRIKTRELLLKKVWWGNNWLPSKQCFRMINFEIEKLNKWWFNWYSNICIM